MEGESKPEKKVYNPIAVNKKHVIAILASALVVLVLIATVVLSRRT
jgi:hypothetical protein